MYRKWFYLIIFLLISNFVYAQNPTFVDFGSNQANGIFTEPDFFSGDGPLGASDLTIQSAFQTLDASGVKILTACKKTDNFCFVFEDNILQLFVGGTKQNTFPF